MKKSLYLFLLLCTCLLGIHAAEGDSLRARRMNIYEGPRVDRFSVETRMGWQMNRTDGLTDTERTGFRGEYINMYLFARVYKGFYFKWRQRLNISNERNFWDSTDYLQLSFKANKHWQFAAGKQVVAIGGYEYDRPAIDLYYNSEFWNNIPCFQLGASATFTFNGGDQLTAQISNSPFRKNIGSNNSYGLSLMWTGKHGRWESLWSANAFETTRGRWINYIALGNRFNFLPHGKLFLELDFIHRAATRKNLLLKDCSIAAELSGRPHSTVRIWGKYTYDVNRSGSDADLCVMNGTEIHGISGGIEYQPIKRYPDMVRLYGVAGYATGTNANPQGTLQDGLVHVNVGLKVNLDLLRAMRHTLSW